MKAEKDEGGSEKHIFRPEGLRSLKQIEFLLKNKAEIFNITPPNAKDDDKGKVASISQQTQKYKLAHAGTRDQWRGFDKLHI